MSMESSSCASGSTSDEESASSQIGGESPSGGSASGQGGDQSEGESSLVASGGSASEQGGDQSEGGESSLVAGDQSEDESSLVDGAGENPPPETWQEHVRTYGEKHYCARCRYHRNRDNWHKTLTYTDKDGEEGTWLEERCDAGHLWGLGCKVCRWDGAQNAWGSTSMRDERMTRLSSLLRHACSRRHVEALAALPKGGDDDGPPEGNLRADRVDVPGVALCVTAYKCAKAGSSFQSYGPDVENARQCGADIPRNRCSREIARRLIWCAAELLREQDRRLLEWCTDISMTMDGRKGKLIVRARLSMGKGMPPDLTLMEASPREDGGALEASPQEDGGGAAITTGHGKHIVTIDRILTLRQADPLETTEELSSHLVDALRDACGDGDDGEALFAAVKEKVRVFTPDGAADEQLAGKLVADSLPGMLIVLRCAAHAVNGAVKAGWTGQGQVDTITREVVLEVAKFVRSSERFAMRIGRKAANDLVASLSNFSFAPQRFASKERAFTRFVCFGKAVMECLALEVAIPTDPQRKEWAARILRSLDGPSWALIGMLADLSEDCVKFVRKFDALALNPIEAASEIAAFDQMLREEYVRGDMWLRREGTFSARVLNMLRDVKIVQYGSECTVIKTPSKAESERCQATIANVARGIKAYLKGQFPSFSFQMRFRCFSLERDFQACRTDLDELLALMPTVFTVDDRILCVGEFDRARPRAVTYRGEGESERDAWAHVVVRMQEASPLRRLVCLMLGFLVSESEAERSFASARNLMASRPRLGVDSICDSLKVMLDGPPVQYLRRSYWHQVQDKYAERYGTRVLGDLKPRADKGKRRKHLDLKREGKVTLTSIKRQRSAIVAEKPVVPIGGESVTVFGYTKLQNGALAELCRQQETDKFKDLLLKAKRKCDEKKAAVQNVKRQIAPRLSMLPARKKALIRKNAEKRRETYLSTSFRGSRRIRWTELRRTMGMQDPWILVYDVNLLPGRGLDQNYGNGPALRTLVAPSMVDFMSRFVDQRCRTILVPDIAEIPWHVQLLAVVLGAHVREHLLVPCFQYKMLGPRMMFAFTAAFAQAHKKVVRVVKEAIRLQIRAGGKSPMYPQGLVLAAVEDVVPQQPLSKALERARTIFYLGETDAELQGMSMAGKQVARTFPEFMRQHGRLEVCERH